MQEQPPTNAADVALCLGPPRGTQSAILAPQRSALCQDLPFEHICSMLLAGHGSRWSAPRELPHQQCSTLSHFGSVHGKEAGANDETCLGRRRSLSRTYALMRLHTITCLDSWVRRMAQITRRKPGAAHRPLARGMKRPSSTALRQGCSPPEYTHCKRMTGSLWPSNGRCERMELRRPKHKPEPKHPAPQRRRGHVILRGGQQDRQPAVEHSRKATAAAKWTITAFALPEGLTRWAPTEGEKRYKVSQGTLYAGGRSTTAERGSGTYFLCLKAQPLAIREQVLAFHLAS